MTRIGSLFVFIFLLSPVLSFGQLNLVKNPGFEDTLQCVGGNSQFQGFAANWRGTAGDYFNSNCQGYLVEVPYNVFGYQFPRTGTAYAGIYCTVVDTYYVHENVRDYIQGELTSPLLAGKYYCVSFYANQPNIERYATPIGYYFSLDSLAFNQYCLSVQPDYMDTSLLLLSDTLNWTLVTDTFLANGGEKYLTIGNFWNDTTSPILDVYPTAPASNQGSYYFIDDVSVMDCGWSGIASLENPYEINLFPNPSHGNMQLNGNFPFYSQLHVYNLLGEEVTEPVTIPKGSQKIPILLNLAAGIYTYRIDSESQILHDGKIVITN